MSLLVWGGRGLSVCYMSSMSYGGSQIMSYGRSQIIYELWKEICQRCWDHAVYVTPNK